MARIPQEEIDRLQREVSVQRLAEARGVKLRRSGQELVGLCPFHRGHRSEPANQSRQKPVALSGSLQRGRRRNRVGDARRESASVMRWSCSERIIFP